MYEFENHLFISGDQSHVQRDGARRRREDYQITGTVVEATGSKVTLEKGTERFEIDIDPATTKGSAELKVGSTVTVTYVMSATKVEGSSAAAAETTPVGPRSAPTP